MADTAAQPQAAIVPDSQHKGLVARLPQPWRDLAQLARFDRPIGWWLLFWPGAWGVLLAGEGAHWGLIGWLLLGSIAMRSAGCVYNDLVDADLDRQVARTALRPVASGRISKKLAWGWLLALCLAGLVVLLQLHWPARLVSLASLLPVAAYPYMKRITWWPQAWLGIVFSWAALTGWVEVRTGSPLGWDIVALAALYLGAICWVIGYDTIYALQDREDDALVGIRSSARAMGAHVRGGVAAFYAAALALWGFAFWRCVADPLVLLALAPMALHLGWQVVTLNPDDGDGALRRFRANRMAGLLMAMACWAVGRV